MKTKSLFLLFLLVAFIGCQKEDDDSDNPLTAGYTTINGHILTSDNTPLKGVKLQVKYIKSRYLAGGHSWLKKEVTTSENGSYGMSFNIKDDEVESYDGLSNSFFSLTFDFSNLNPDKYFLLYYSVDNDYLLSINPSLKQDATYTISCYIPAKDYITVHLNNFKPVLATDHFEVQTFFPWGINSGENVGSAFIDTEYGINSSGYDNFVAKSENQTFRVPVARNETNVVRIVKMKNGVAYPEDHKLFVPKDNSIELSFEY
jgi:hypothetical protein